MTNEQDQQEQVSDVLDFGESESTQTPTSVPDESARRPIIKTEEDEALEEEEEFEQESQAAEEDDYEEPAGDEDEEEEDDGPTLDDFEALQEQNKELLEQMNQMGSTMQQTGGFQGAQQQMQQQQAPVQAPAQQPAQQPLVLDELLLSPEELDRVIDRPELINAAIQRAVTGAVQHTQQSVGSVANTVQQQIQQAMWAKEVTDRFFTQNEDLRDPNMRQYVSNVAGNMMHQQQATGQPINFEQVLSAAGKAVRTSLGIKQRVEPASKPKPKGGKVLRRKARKPSFAGASSGRSRRSKAPKRSKQQQDMDELFD